MVAGVCEDGTATFFILQRYHELSVDLFLKNDLDMNYTTEELESEKWKDIEGYDGVYQVSDLGRVRSLKYGKERILKGNVLPSGYIQVGLHKNGRTKMKYIHRLVANAFITNDDSSKNQVNHINECKQNNRVNNLEYCTPQYNLTYNDLHHRRKQYNCKHRKLKGLYDHNLDYAENLEIFRANGIDCSKWIVEQLSKDLGLIKTSV